MFSSPHPLNAGMCQAHSPRGHFSFRSTLLPGLLIQDVAFKLPLSADDSHTVISRQDILPWL